MARSKPIVSRTFAPIHFEDLDPHRFEDLIRELIYDFRDWQTIEATGRSGGDSGFDIRAFEKLPSPVPPDEEDEESVELRHPMDGPQWMIQGKREKTLTPLAVKKILADVDATSPPYGYILAASAVFSKKSYDVFRDELRKKGVMEFYLWGRPELEDMLHLPKNDRILFTFFGISLVSRRRSRSTEIRATVTTKNKLYKLLGDPSGLIEASVLIRDINDDHYPFEGDYPDFDKTPRWIERTVFAHHPKGLRVHNREYFAFVDIINKKWDYTEHCDSLVGRRDVITDAEREEYARKRDDVLDIWNFLPRAQKGTFAIEANLPYSRIALIDPSGDQYHSRPHLYVEFVGPGGPYSGFREVLSVGDLEIELDEHWQRIEFFPKKFTRSAVKHRIHRTNRIALNPEVLKTFMDYTGKLDTLYAVDNRFDFLSKRDVVPVANSGKSGESDRLLEVRHIQTGPFVEYLNAHSGKFHLKHAATRQIGREIADDEKVTVVEVEPTYLMDWERQGE